jgi:hypothetical protein
MLSSTFWPVLRVILLFIWPSFALRNESSIELLRVGWEVKDDRPDNCPPWFVDLEAQYLWTLSDR